MASPPSAADFKVAFPEFVGASDALVNATISRAVGRTDPVVWGASWGAGVMQRTADLLAKSPMGQKMRLTDKSGVSIYFADLQAMIRRVSSGFRVT